MSTLVQLARLDEIRPGQMLRVEHDGHAYLLANVDGEILAADDTCTHEDAPLSIGALHGDCVSCSLHGAVFNLRTGAPVEEPASEPLRTYAVEVRDGAIFVALPGGE